MRKIELVACLPVFQCKLRIVSYQGHRIIGKVTAQRSQQRIEAKHICGSGLNDVNQS